ncbi:MAG: hypothetical protein RL458_798 [Pseudomonadota bacterium]
MTASHTPHSTLDPEQAPAFPAPSVGPNRTGGAVWHVRALRASGRWRPTREAIASWLGTLRFESRHLVLVGASAGWMMSTDFLERFRCIEAIDIDPLARPLFAWRHGRRLRRAGTSVHWHRLDALLRLEALMARWPDAAWLFDNVLGQQIYRHHDLDAVEAALAGLPRRLAGREWASVHDWLSGPALPGDVGAVLSRPIERAVLEPTGLRLKDRNHSLDAAGEALLATINASGEWQDHRTACVFPPGTSVSLIPWEFLPGKWHWLQAGCVLDRNDRTARS